MGYFDSPANVDAYLKMVEGYDGSAVVAEVRKHVPAGARLLELGMGGGTDLDLLADAGFDVTGSDGSSEFLRRYVERGGRHPTVLLDARTVLVDGQFDAIFTNKVLQHLTRDELRASLARQAEVVVPGGTLFHTLWAGEQDEEHHGLRFSKYTPASFETLVPSTLQQVALGHYDEMAARDSFWVVLRRTPL